MSDYAFDHDGKAYTPNQTKVTDTKAHNAAIERAELEVWDNGPEGFIAYYDDKRRTISTWLGTEIGEITDFRVYRHNFGGRMVSLRVDGSNSLKYYGRASFDSGNVVKLRAVKRSR
jgi:hypothetical protein